MKTSDVIAHFGTIYKVAQKLKITKQSVANWGYIVPIGFAAKIQNVTGGEVKLDTSIYANGRTVDVGGIKYQCVEQIGYAAFMRRVNAGKSLYFLVGKNMESVFLGEKSKMRERFRSYELFEVKAP